MYAIWFNVVERDARALWPAGALTDRRVTHFWDEGRIVGTWYGRHPDYLAGAQLLWDAYLLYDRPARWDGKPSHLVSWGGTILRKRGQLKADLLAVAGRR